MTLFLWPAIIRFYSSRFLYEALPLWIATIAFLVFSNRSTSSKKFALFLLIIMFNSYQFTKTQLGRENRLKHLNQCLATLAQEKSLHQCHLWFIGIPYEDFCTGMAQAMYMYGFPTDKKIFYDKETFTRQYSQRSITESKINLSINHATLTLTLPHFLRFSFYDSTTSLGEKTFSSDGQSLSLQFTSPLIPLDDVAFVTWDYNVQRFVVITSEKNH